MAPTTSRPCATACLQVLPTTESRHARCLLPFDDRTFVGDVRSSEKCHELTSCSGWKSIRSTTMERLDRRAVQAEARACCIGMETCATSWLKRRGRGDWKASHPHDCFGRRFEGDAIAQSSHFPSRVSADALVRRTCADG